MVKEEVKEMRPVCRVDRMPKCNGRKAADCGQECEERPDQSCRASCLGERRHEECLARCDGGRPAGGGDRRRCEIDCAYAAVDACAERCLGACRAACGKKEEEVCTEVRVMKCRMEPRVVVKEVPRTDCSRAPRKLCRKVKCRSEGRCMERVTMRKSTRPEEMCSYRPRRVCHSSESACRDVQREVCSGEGERCDGVVTNAVETDARGGGGGGVRKGFQP